ncbi:MAG TPA: hypothetical protein VEQ59_05555 [Polyangiaceae bacterium]|nr:hypothetical protein [Polyangiaceae bacterium]
MRAKTGVVGMWLMALGALFASLASTAEARPSVVPVVAKSPQAQPASTTSGVVASSSEPVLVVVLGAITAPLEIVTPPPADLRLENPKLRRMQKAEITPAMLARAAKLVREHYAKPVGTQVEVEVEGKRVIARLERHFHPEGGPVKPWGFHPGVSLFVAR